MEEKEIKTKRTPLTEEEKRERKNARQAEYARKTGYASNAKYNKERGTSVAFRLFSPQDDDVLQKLSQVPSKAGYIKELIRKDISESKK